MIVQTHEENVGRSRCFLLIAIAALVVAASPGSGAAWARDHLVLRVDGRLPAGGDGTSWSTAFGGPLALQDCLALATGIPENERDIEIWIAKGTYWPAIYQGPASRELSFKLLNNAEMYGGFQGNETDRSQRNVSVNQTILSGDLLHDDEEGPNVNDNSWHVVLVDNLGANAVLDGCIIERGNANGSVGPDPNVGGGILCRAGATSPTIRNCTLRFNRAVAGGGMYSWDATRPLVTGCTFERNTAFEPTQIGGGGVLVAGTALFERCRFVRNHSESRNQGGGAILLAPDRDAGVDLVSTDFIGNTIHPASAGSASLTGMTRTWVRATNCRFLGNLGGFAAGLSVGSVCTAHVTGCLFAANESLEQSGFGTANASTAVLTNCTFVANRTTRPAPASFAAFGMGDSTAAVRNCVFWGNTAGGVGGLSGQMNLDFGTRTIRYCSVEGGAGLPGDGNDGNAPLFASLPSPGPDNLWGTSDDVLDVWLSADSPAIDSGDTCLEENGSCTFPPDIFDVDSDGNTTEATPLDIAGNSRFYDDPNRSNTGIGSPPIDRGAYESSLSASAWINPLGGRFTDGASWSSGVPNSTVRAFFDARAGGTNRSFTITVPSNQSVYSAAVTSNDITLNLRAVPGTGSLFVMGPGTDPANPALLVGQVAGLPVALRVVNTGAIPVPQKLETTNAVVAGGFNSVATLEVSGARAAFNALSSLDLGRVGTGAMNVRAGSTANVGSLRLGTLFGASGTLAVTADPGLESTLIYGASGAAGFELVVGDAGSGSISVTGGGVFGSPYVDDAVIARAADSVGSVTISGPDSIWASSQNRFVVGEGGAATLAITNGAALATSSNQIVLAQNPDSSALVTVGSGSTWVEDVTTVAVSGEGSAELRVEQSGVVNFDLGLSVNRLGTLSGRGTVDANVFNVGTVRPGDGAQPAAGTLTINGNYRQVGALPGGTPDTGSLVMDVAGRTAGVDYDQLLVSGQVELGGGLVIRRSNGSTFDFRGPGGGPLSLQLVPSLNITKRFDVIYLPGLARLENEPPRFLRVIYGGVAPGGVTLIDALLGGDPTFGDDRTFTVGGGPTALVIADLDGQNGPDLALTVPDETDPTGANGDVVILFNLGGSGSSWNEFASAVQIPVGRNPADLVVADLDGRPGLDIGVANFSSNTVSLLFSQGDGTFSTVQTLSGFNGPRGIAAADLDGERLDLNDRRIRKDLVVVNALGDDAVVLGNRTAGGVANFTPPLLLRTGQGGGRTIAYDDDNDKDLPIGPPADVAVANRTDGLLVFFRNNGNGTFQAPLGVTVGSDPVAVVGAMLDRDGRRDFAVVNQLSHTVSVIVRRANGDYAPAVDLAVGSAPSAITAADFDDDGDDDLALCAAPGGGPRRIQILRNDTVPGDEQATFAQPRDEVSGSSPVLIASGNVDNDPDDRRDIVTIDGTGPRAGPNVNVRRNGPEDVCGADFNGDGSVDFFDYLDFVAAFDAEDAAADFNGDEVVDFFDYLDFVAAFDVGCG